MAGGAAAGAGCQQGDAWASLALQAAVAVEVSKLVGSRRQLFSAVLVLVR